MSLEIVYTAEFGKLFAELPKPIQAKAKRRIQLFRENPFLSILETEKLNIPFAEFWSFRVDRAYRIAFRFTGSGCVIFDAVGHHAWIYRLIARWGK